MIKLKTVRFSLSILLFTLIVNFSSAFAQASAEQGEKIFKQNCTSCHSIGTTKVVGPGLKDVIKRVPSEDWLKTWIKNSSAVIKSGDAYAKKIYEENNKAAMSSFDNLKDDQLASLIEYLKNPPAPKQAAAASGGAAGTSSSASNEDGIWNYVLLALAAIFIILIVVLGGIKETLARLVRERDGLPEPVKLATIPAVNAVKV